MSTPTGNAHRIHTGDELRSGSAGNDAGGVPCSTQRPFFLLYHKATLDGVYKISELVLLTVFTAT